MHLHDTIKLPVHTRGEEAGPRHAQVGSQHCKLSPAKGRTHTARGSGVLPPPHRGKNSLADSCQPQSPSCFSDSFWKRIFTTRLGPNSRILSVCPQGQELNKTCVICYYCLPPQNPSPARQQTPQAAFLNGLASYMTRALVTLQKQHLWLEKSTCTRDGEDRQV